MRRVALSEIKDHFSEYLRKASKEQIVITKHGKPAGVLIGFATEDDWFDYKLENDPQFFGRVAEARASLRAGRGIPWEEIEAEDDRRAEKSTKRGQTYR
jgi:prevent-host-death family protein